MGISKILLVQEQDQMLETWEDGSLKELSPGLWKTLLSAGKTDSQGITMEICKMEICKILPGNALIRHRHAYLEAYYILEGHGLMEIDGQTQTVTTGSAEFIPGNTKHVITNSGTQTLQFL